MVLENICFIDLHTFLQAPSLAVEGQDISPNLELLNL